MGKSKLNQEEKDEFFRTSFLVVAICVAVCALMILLKSLGTFLEEAASKSEEGKQEEKSELMEVKGEIMGLTGIHSMFFVDNEENNEIEEIKLEDER